MEVAIISYNYQGLILEYKYISLLKTDMYAVLSTPYTVQQSHEGQQFKLSLLLDVYASHIHRPVEGPIQVGILLLIVSHCSDIIHFALPIVRLSGICQEEFKDFMLVFDDSCHTNISAEVSNIQTRYTSFIMTPQDYPDSCTFPLGLKLHSQFLFSYLAVHLSLQSCMLFVVFLHAVWLSNWCSHLY